MKRIIAMALMLLASIGMMAQAIKVTGSVKTETSEPLAGVAVTIKALQPERHPAQMAPGPLMSRKGRHLYSHSSE